MAKLSGRHHLSKFEHAVGQFLARVAQNIAVYANVSVLNEEIHQILMQYHAESDNVIDLGFDHIALIYEIADQVALIANGNIRTRLVELFVAFTERFPLFYVFALTDHRFSEKYETIISAAKSDNMESMREAIDFILTGVRIECLIVKAEQSVLYRCFIYRLTEIKDSVILAKIISMVGCMIVGFYHMVLRFELESYMNSMCVGSEKCEFNDINFKLTGIAAYVGMQYNKLEDVMLVIIMNYINPWGSNKMLVRWLSFI